jgi:hypothetical protein
MTRNGGVLAFGVLALAGCAGGAVANGDGGEDSGPAATVQVAGSFSMYGGAVGYGLTTETDAQNFDSSNTIAIVADLGQSWAIETESSATPDYVIGLTVDKETGAVTSAVMGKPGERGVSIKILETAPPPGAPKKGVAEEVPIEIGSFPSIKRVEDYGTTWTGTEPELEGVLLKYASASGDYELAELPDETTESVGGVTVKVSKLVYSNQRTEWRTRHPVVASLRPLGSGYGIFRLSNETSTTEVTSLQTDARAKLRWE